MRVPGIGLLCAGIVLVGASVALAANPGKSDFKYRAVAPAVARGDAATVAVPTPTPYIGPVVSLSLGSGGVTENAPVEVRDVDYKLGGPEFQVPTHPSRIAWYSAYGIPGWRGNNSIFAAHINYVGYGNGPFARLASAVVGDALYIRMANAQTYTYTVKSVQVIHLADLDMPSVVFPALGSNMERVTLISCGGTFVPLPGGGEYDSRVVVVAERYVP